MSAHSCAPMKGAPQTIWKTITAIVCFTVLIFALDMKGILYDEVVFFVLLVLIMDSVFFQISLQMHVYVHVRITSGMMNTEMQYLKQFKSLKLAKMERHLR